MFQGYMPHAVMPLVMGGGEGVVVETEGDGGCTDGGENALECEGVLRERIVIGPRPFN